MIKQHWLGMGNIDRSSWVSWACYYLGFMLAWGPELQRDVQRVGTGTVLLLTAIAAFFVAVVTIQRHMRIALTSPTFGEPQQLVTDGVFHYSRNPIYLAFLVPLAALAYYSVPASLTAIVVYLVAMTRFVIAREEAVLQDSFGASFAAYCAAVPRWLLF